MLVPKKLRRVFGLLLLAAVTSGCAGLAADTETSVPSPAQKQEREANAIVSSPEPKKATPSETPAAVPAMSAPIAQKPVLCIEAGHQGSGNSEQEPVGPGSSATKAKVSGGTQGVATGKPEYELNLEIALKLQKALENDYDIIMVREMNDVDMSNKERAQFCSVSGASLMVRLHADGSEDPNVHGMSLLYPSPDSEYTREISAESLAAARFLKDGIVDSTSVSFNGFKPRDDLTGFNWLTIPSVLIEAGFMSNPEEDRKLSQSDYQQQIVTGIKKGLDRYYASKPL